MESAALNLGFCRIISPVDGIAGTALAQIGDLVGPGGARADDRVNQSIRCVSISTSANRITWIFTGNSPTPTELDAYRSEMQLQLILSDGSIYPNSGQMALYQPPG